MKKTKKVKYKVVCANDDNHIFEYVFTIYEGTETEESDVEAFCPFCDDFVSITIKGIVPPESILRRFDA